MLALNRKNDRGEQYYLVESMGPPIQTVIRNSGGKQITVNHSIRDLNRGWYLWMNGTFIQDAFKFLSAEEREFLQTGITPEEWKTLFGAGRQKGNGEN